MSRFILFFFQNFHHFWKFNFLKKGLEKHSCFLLTNPEQKKKKRPIPFLLKKTILKSKHVDKQKKKKKKKREEKKKKTLPKKKKNGPILESFEFSA